jgi:tRNA (mo5U34)-methyltransferase
MATQLWYHTLDLPDGYVTPGWFDLRPIVERLPWPEVSGRRCLDVGTYDGFLAFELERRGAAEVVATDIGDHTDWDWPPRDRARGIEYLSTVAGQKGRGFELAAEALGSRVERRLISVYDLSREAVGEFDVVVCGSLLLHLRDPFRALEAIRGVCSGHFLSVEQIDFRLTAMSPRWPVLRLSGDEGQWCIPNAAGHVRMLSVGGFDVVEAPKPFNVPFGQGHPHREQGRRQRLRSALERAYLGGPGLGARAVLARPALPA